MNDDSGSPGGFDDTGEPIAELALLGESPAAGFLTRIRNRVHRRIFAADTVDFSLVVFFQTFLDYLMVGLQSVLGPQRQKGERD